MRKLRRFRPLLLGLGIVVILFAAYNLWPQGVWPFVTDLDHLVAAGRQYEVTILRDTWGVPHIFGSTDAATAYGLAYANAEDDFLTIQQTLAAAHGQLGAIYGPEAAPNDYMVHLLRLQETAAAQYPRVPADVRTIMDAYADGLNHYAALHTDELLSADLFPLTGADIAAGFLHKLPLFFGLDGVLGELFAAASADEASTPVALCPTTPFLCAQSTFFGSNAIAIAPSRAQNGETMLLINSHQPWEGPVTWYEAHLHSEEGWDAVGGLLPGSPAINHGTNRHLGWAFTVNTPDLVDVYMLEINPENENQYRFDGQWRDLEVGQAPIRVKLFGRFFWTVTREVLWSVYGPTVRRPHGTYAIRYAGMGELGTVEQFYRMNKAANFAEWEAALAAGPLPMFNTVYADRTGNIFYVYNGRIPDRAPGYDWQHYLPGNTAETLWQDYLPFSALPQVYNPAAGFVQNANNTPYRTSLSNNPDPAAFPAEAGIDDPLSNRALRILQLIGADPALTPEELLAYKYDMQFHPDSDVGRMVEILRAGPPPDSSPARAAWELVRDWDLQARPQSTAASVALLTLNYLLEAEGSEISVANMVGGQFSETAVWSSFLQAVETLQIHFERVDVPWEDLNRLRRGELDLGLGGAPDLLHAVYGELGEDGRFDGIAGDSYILFVTWTAAGEIRAQSVHQYGSATSRPHSPHFADQAPLFVRRRLKPVWLNEADIRANLGAAYVPGEE